MKYYFTWNSQILIDERVKAWKTKFILQFGDFNFIKINNLEDFDNNYLIELLTWWSFLSEKKLIIIKINWGKIEEEKIDYIISLFNNIPEDNILLFHETNPDKRTKYYKFLKENSNYSEYSIINDNHLVRILIEKYKDRISSEAVDKIISYKAGNLAKIYQELDKLFITKNNITLKDIEENIIPELEESIFQIIDALMNLNKQLLIDKINNLLNYTNIYAFYNNFVSNIRTNIFILKYKSLKIRSIEIQNQLNLWKRWFIVDKNYKINYEKLKKFYIWLIDLDKRLKTWQLFKNDEEVFKFEIDKMIMEI